MTIKEILLIQKEKYKDWNWNKKTLAHKKEGEFPQGMWIFEKEDNT
jgi:hypothetical protein